MVPRYDGMGRICKSYDTAVTNDGAQVVFTRATRRVGQTETD